MRRPVDAKLAIRRQSLRGSTKFGSPATVATTGGRYFGFVIGGSLSAVMAASWLASAWDQNKTLRVTYRRWARNWKTPFLAGLGNYWSCQRSTWGIGDLHEHGKFYGAADGAFCDIEARRMERGRRRIDSWRAGRADLLVRRSNLAWEDGDADQRVISGDYRRRH
jgi:hypothetical protein